VNSKEIEKRLINLALAEDLGSGDITTRALRLHKQGKAIVVAKAPGIISGLASFMRVYKTLSPDFTFNISKRDGERVVPGSIVIGIKGPVSRILIGERTAMNLLCHLSGVATITRSIVDEVRDLPVKILDTRKTLPGMRSLEKKAVRDGGASNHRMGLYDMYLIKENHIAASGGIDNALRSVTRHKKRTGAKIEIEVKNLDELKVALEYDPDYLLLDNFNVSELKKSVRYARSICPKAILEASGNMNQKTVRRVAMTGVDRISVGKITHSAPALDLSLKVIK